MIDTDKYEVAYGKWSVGHEGQHDLPEGDIPINVNGGLMAIAYSQADAQLIADAPLLLAEVLRLRKQMVATQERIALANKALHRNADTKSHLAHMICRAIDALELIE